jgi:hypothetical protein
MLAWSRDMDVSSRPFLTLVPLRVPKYPVVIVEVSQTAASGRYIETGSRLAIQKLDLFQEDYKTGLFKDKQMSCC